MNEPIPVPPPTPVHPGPRGPGHPPRLARLRPEFRSLYPGLDAGAWYPAASVADYFRSWLVRHPDRRQPAPLRGLDTDHFEFRGGIPREEPWLAGKSPDERRPTGSP